MTSGAEVGGWLLINHPRAVLKTGLRMPIVFGGCSM
jgi:hypothetical protein